MWIQGGKGYLLAINVFEYTFILYYSILVCKFIGVVTCLGRDKFILIINNQGLP
jgi:hypothetical protein